MKIEIGKWYKFGGKVGRVADVCKGKKRTIVVIETPEGIWRNQPVEHLVLFKEYMQTIAEASDDEVKVALQMCARHIQAMKIMLKELSVANDSQPK